MQVTDDRSLTESDVIANPWTTSYVQFSTSSGREKIRLSVKVMFYSFYANINLLVTEAYFSRALNVTGYLTQFI